MAHAGWQQRLRLFQLAAVSVVLLSSPHPAQAGDASFRGVGDLPGGSIKSQAYAISADGSVVVGTSIVDGMPWDRVRAFRWTADGGMVGLNPPPLGTESDARGVSADGSVIVGRWVREDDGVSWNVFRWTQSGGMQDLSNWTSGFAGATGVSASGAVVVGWLLSSEGNAESFHWTSGTGIVELAPHPAGFPISNAHGVSADGTRVVGFGTSDASTQAYRWTANEGMLGLGSLPGGGASSANAISADGLVIVGESSSATGTTAFRWTAEGGMVGLGDLPGGVAFSSSLAVSGDGAVVVGWGMATSGQEPFIWDTCGGIRSLRDVLENEHGLNLSGWDLSNATGVSADGMTLVGNGLNPLGFDEGWIAHIPELPRPSCDLNQDGSSNGLDIPVLVTVFAAGTDDPTLFCRADGNGSGAVDEEDIPLFVDCLLAGE